MSACARLARRWRAAWIAVLLVWLVVAGFSTRYNAGIWGDRSRLATVWAQQKPQSLRAAQMLASYHADTGDVDSARTALDDAMRRMPEKPVLRLQRILLDCVDRGVTHAQWNAALALARDPDYDRSFPDLAASFVRQANTGACRGTLTRGDARRLVETLLGNPAYGDEDSQGFLYYELSRLDLADKNLEALIRHMDLSHHFRPNPLVAREQAIYLLTAGLPADALRYLDRSEAAPIPAFKRWLLDMPARNTGLRESARRMMASRAAAND